ncbi:hypothetical protein AXF42_Ash000199 [Apostasia shenzhenica]|uniref:Uncharacterized protein n=1 Tax=Apostasia shenzhenica TaxID=1088818 RepID=A0A2I0AFT9_9ASPA|nr:hypothetical protein AXF42_Ash000199 [Apostasia shenzhenica]
MAGQDTLKNLERLKGQSWPLKDFLRHVRNYISMYAKALGSEVGEEEEIEVPEPVCGGTAVNVVSSPEDAIDDRKTLAKLGYTRKGKGPVSAAKPQTIPKGAKGSVIGEKEEGNKADGGQEKERTEGPCLNLILSEVPKKKNGPSESTSPEPPSKKAKSVEEEGFATGGEHDWQQSVEPPYNTNFIGIFWDEGTRMAVRMRGDERRLTVVSLPSTNQGGVYRGEVGLALGSGQVSKGLEEKLERTSTLERYSGFTNRVATVRILYQAFSPICSCELTLFLLQILARLQLALNRALRTEEKVLEQGRQLHQRDGEIEALRVQFAMKSSQLDAIQEEKAKLKEKFVVYKSVMSALKADNKALREKMDKVAENQEIVAAERSAAAVKAYKTSLSCRKERLEGIRRAWEGLASTLIQGGKITASDLGEVDPFPCVAADPTYREEGFDLTDDLIHQVFDLLDGISEG